MGIIQTLGRTAWRKFITDGVPSSGANKPLKSEIIAFVDAVDTQVAAIANGIEIRLAHVDLCTTGNITLSGEQTIDGVLTSADRVLVAYQTLPAANGIYVTGAGAWTRATDANTTAELYRAAVFVLAGTANEGNTFFCTIASTATLGTDACPWVVIDSDAVVAGLQAEIDALEALMPSGTVVGTTDAQTLTNKTLTNPSINGATFGGVNVFDYSGLRIEDSDGSHTLNILPTSNLTADRFLAIVTGDANRQLDISAGNVTISTAGAALVDDATAADQRTTLGLGNVTNTSDANKPVSTAQQTALDLKANLASPTFTGTVAGITKSMVGLGNVDNTSDANKPVSTAQQTALDFKAPLASPALTGNPTAPTPSPGDNDTSIATTAFVKAAVDVEASARSAADTAQGVINTAISDAIVSEAGTRAAGDGVLNGYIATERARIDGIEPMILAEREGAQFWSNVITGLPVNRAALSVGSVVTNNDGKAVRVTGNGTFAPRAAYRIRDDHVLSIEWAARRATNPTDPLGDSVSLMIAWLDKNYAIIGSATLVESINLTVANGRVKRIKKLAAASGLGADYVGPSGTIYAVPYVQTFGPDGVTDIDWPLATDLTAMLDLSAEIADQLADLGDITAAVAAAEQAAADAEAALAAINGTPGVNGLFSNVYLAKTAAYTVVNGDSGKTISLAGSDCYTLTFGAASTYDNEFGVIVVNGDAGRAKFISLNGTVHKLWPDQRATILNVNDVWKIEKPERWRLKQETVFYVDSTAGVNNTNDGLAPGSGGAWAHEMLLYTHIVENIDIGGDFHLILQFADGTYTHGLHLAAHLIGRDGGDNFVIRGENTTGTILAPASAAGVGIYTGQSVRIRNMRIESASGNGVETAQAAGTMYIGANVVFGGCGGSHMSATDGHIVIDNPYTIDGDAGVGHYNAAAKGLIDGAGQTITVAQNVSFGTAFAIASSNGVIGTTGFTFSLGAFTVTGPRYLLATGGVINIGTLSETYFPGTVAGSNTGGQYNNAFGALTWTGLQTFAATTGFPVFYTFTDDGATGPQTVSQHISTTVAVNDIINKHLMQAKDSGGTTTTYASWSTRIGDATDTSEDGLYDISTVGAGTLAIRHTTGLGFYMAGATGGDKGAGTINATAVYDDNVLLSCYVFDQAFDKKISSKKWDALVPDRTTAIMENAIETYIDSDGVEQSYKTSKPTGKFHVEKRIHEPMRKFRDRAGTEYDPLTLEGYLAHCRDKRHLPSMPNEQKFDPAEGMPAGAWIQRLVEDAEIKAVLMGKMHERIEALEAALAKASKATH